MQYLTFIISIVIAVLILVGLIYLWDHYAGENMRKGTIAVLSIVTVFAIALSVFLSIFAWQVKDITKIGDVFMEDVRQLAGTSAVTDNDSVSVVNDTVAVNDTVCHE